MSADPNLALHNKAGRTTAKASNGVPDSFRADSASARPTESITLRDSRHGTGVWPPSSSSLTAVCMHTASDVFVILKAGPNPPGAVAALRLRARVTATAASANCAATS